MAGLPDPKPTRRRGNRPRRVTDASASQRCLLRWRACAACGRPAANAHHVLPKDRGGDDVDADLTSVCGSGTARCHGALHGNPYVDDTGRRWTSADVHAAIGAHLAARRPDTIAYVLEKLGDEPGRDYLARVYGVTVEAPC